MISYGYGYGGDLGNNDASVAFGKYGLFCVQALRLDNLPAPSEFVILIRMLLASNLPLLVLSFPLGRYL